MRQFILITALVLFQPAFAGACDLQSLSVTGNRLQAGKFSATLGEADDMQHPGAWLGPIKVHSADARTCRVSDEVAIVEKPLLLGNDHILFLPTYSGSTNRVYAVDLRSCAVVWKSSQFSGATSHANDVLITGRRTLKLPLSCVP